MRTVVLALLTLCTGCTHLQYGGKVNGAGVQVNAGNALGAVLLGGMLTAAAVEGFRDSQPIYPAFSDWIGSRPAPAMSADRSIAEQDCTKPVALTDNLRCR
ncbi:MAG TPA: hypothetical protein VE325_08190 [Burkholderiales bacterium]|nr:hypothetical protein [Burkholderiales bacterium]